MSKIKKEAAVIILINDGKVLILKRSANLSSFPKYWNFPGGNIEEDETPKEAAARELKEEANLITSPENLVAIGFNELPNLKIHYFITNIYTGNLKINNESSQFKWVSQNDLEEINLIPMPDKILSRIYYFIGKLNDS